MPFRPNSLTVAVLPPGAPGSALRVDTAWCLAGVGSLLLYIVWFCAGAHFGRWIPRGGPLVVSQAAMVVFYALAGCMQWRVSRNGLIDAATRRAWLTLASANLGVIALSGLWFLRALRGTGPTPTDQLDVVSTVIYALTNAVGFLAIIRFPTSQRLRADRVTFWLDAGAVGSAGLLLAWHLLFRAAIASAGGGGAKTIGALVYPAADVMLLFGTIALLIRRPLPRSVAALRVLTFALALSTIADVPMVWDSLAGGRHGATLSDLLYIVVAWLLGVSAYVQSRRVHIDPSRVRDAVADRVPTYSLMPYAAIGIVYLFLAVEAYRVAMPPGHIAAGAGSSLLTLVVGAAVVTGFVVARQVVVLHRNDELMTDRLVREAYFRALVQHSSDPIIVLKSGGIIREASPAVADVLGHDWESLVGRPITDLLEPDNVAAACADLESIRAESGVASQRAAPHEWKFRHADGRARYIEVRCTDLLADATVHGIIINGRDITERRMLEEQLRQVQKMEALGQLTGGVAHDLNNLFTVIISNAELLGLDIEGQPEIRQSVDDMHGAARRGATLVRKLLSFSRVDKLERSPLRLAPFFSDIAYLLRRILPVNITLETSSQMDEFVVFADKGALEQLFVNLATNARDAMPDGGTLSIGVSSRVLDEAFCAVQGRGTSGRHVMISIRDTGCGMTDEVRQRVFEPFFTTKARGAGTGLGLTIAYGVVRHHEGFLEVESAPSAGTEIRILLPLSNLAELPATPRVALDVKPGLGGLVLVVDDEEPIRRLTQRLLERQGYTVVSAADGRDALDVIDAHRGKIELVISDLLMPRMGGRELLAELRASGELCPPFLFVSGYSVDTASDLLATAGEVEFMNKPWETRQFIARVEAMMEAHARIPSFAA